MWEAGESIVSREYRYSLTRVCLNRGQISCTQSLASFFPSTGNIKVTDTITGDVLELKSDHSDKYKPRIIQGLGNFYLQHGLQVNDTISFRYAEDSDQGVIQVTPTKARRRIDFNDQSALKALIDFVAKSPKPLSESDIHAQYPDLPHNADLNALFKQDSRITKHEGRWQNASLRTSIAEVSRPVVQAKPKQEEQKKQEQNKELVATGALQADSSQGSPLQDASAQLRAPNDSLGSDMHERIEAFHHTTDADTVSQKGQGLRDSIAKGRPAFFAPKSGEATIGEQKLGSGMQEISSSISGFAKGKSVNVPETNLTQEKAIQFTGDYAALHKEAREKLEPLGFSVSSIEQGQLLLKADLGRDNYSVLMYLLPDANGLNWPSALAQRRKTDVKYLSILGNSDDLLKVDNSASVFRATKWSWQALDRILQINEHIDVGPAALEPCFRETGLDLPQVDVFQNLLNQHLQEVGLFSQIIQSLASRRVPSIFVLDDIMTELSGPGLNAPRDVVVATLKTLSQVPFKLIQETDNHEFVISKDISKGLSNLENYCVSLKANLPERLGVDRIPAASDEPSELF